MPAPLVPEDDLYDRLGLAPDALPEAVELAWRALLKRHHPDVAGDGSAALDRAKRINVAHDWLGDPALRARYDRERLGAPHGAAARAASSRRPVRGYRPAPRHPAAPRAYRGSPARPDLLRGTPGERLARLLDRVGRLTPVELDRLAVAEPPPIAFLATIRRFVTPEARAAFARAETQLAAGVARERWTEAGVRDGLQAVLAELVFAPFLDETLAEPFRSRARERLLRAWDASLDQPRHGPNGAEVAALRDRVAVMSREEVAAFARASTGIAGDDRPWPASLDREDDEALRISAVLAARDVAAAIPVADLAPATAARIRRLAARLGHVVSLRHAFSPAAYAAHLAPFAAATDAGPTTSTPGGPGVRRAP